jgi:hypothetical protein
MAQYPASIDLVALNGTSGFRFVGRTANSHAGNSVAAGDLNGDGFADLIVGAPRQVPPAGSGPSAAGVT